MTGLGLGLFLIGMLKMSVSPLTVQPGSGRSTLSNRAL